MSLSVVKSAAFYNKRSMKTASTLLVNFVGSILIILCNKALYSTEFGNAIPPMLLASFHFMSTFIGLVLLAALGAFKMKRVSLLRVLPLCVAFCMYVVFTNLSLKLNTIGTYQMIKCLADPLTFFLQVKFYGKKFNKKIILSLLINVETNEHSHHNISIIVVLFSIQFTVVVGIFINYFSAVKINVLGGICGLLAVIASSFYCTPSKNLFTKSMFAQWVGTKQEELNLSPAQLLFYQSSISSVLLWIPILCIEQSNLSLLVTSLPDNKTKIFCFSCLLAFFVNTSVFYIIRHTSVVSYAVFCKLKICLVVVGGCFIFHERLTILQSMGIALTLVGTFFYVNLKLNNLNNNGDHLLEVKSACDKEARNIP